MTRTTRVLLRIIGAAAVVGGLGGAGLSAQAPRAESAPRNSLAISGQIVDAEGPTVRLHADGIWLAIDLSGWAWAERKDPSWLFLEIGEEITAYAPLRASLFSDKVVRPSEVYVHGRSAHFRLDQGDASWEAQAVPQLDPYAITPDTVTLSGIVRRVGSDEFVIEAGGIDIVIDTSEMMDDPLDVVGGRALAPGDLVQVRGPISAMFLAERVLEARRITSIVDLDAAGEG